MVNPNIKLLNTSRGPVEYLDTGSGTTVLSLHGAMGGYDQAQILVRTIGKPGYRSLAVSRPGYLGTPLAAGITPEEQADLYAEFLDLLAITKVIVFAISGGGPSAIHFALRHREKCHGLVLASTVGGKTKNKIPFLFYVMACLAKWPAIVNMMKRKTEKDLKHKLQHSISDPDISERTVSNIDAMALYKELKLGMFSRISERIQGTKNDIQITRTRTYPLKDITVPTLIIHGTKDPHVPFEDHGMRLADEIPSARLFAAKGGEHITIFTHRNDVQRKVAAFLKDLDLSEIKGSNKRKSL